MKFKIQSASVTDKGLNPRKTINEDGYLVLPGDGVFAVADGVGGAFAGDIASQTALETIEKMARNARPRNAIGFVQNSINASNAVVYKIGEEKKNQMASTIAMMVIEDNFAILGHVGDSRIYVSRDGQLIQLTVDHSRLQALIDRDPEKKSNWDAFPGKHIITKALGVDSKVEPDIQKVILKDDDIFILCTDGIHNYNSNDEILMNVKKHNDDLNEVCQITGSRIYPGANLIVELRGNKEKNNQGATINVTP